MTSEEALVVATLAFCALACAALSALVAKDDS